MRTIPSLSELPKATDTDLAKWLRYAVRMAELEFDPTSPYRKIPSLAWGEAEFQTEFKKRTLERWCRGEGKPPTRGELETLCERLHLPDWLCCRLFEAAGFEMGFVTMEIPTTGSPHCKRAQEDNLRKALDWIERNNPHGYQMLCKALDLRENGSEFDQFVRLGRMGRR